MGGVPTVGAMPMQRGGGGGGIQPPFQINFAPKIITGGNDNSVGADPVATTGGGAMMTSGGEIMVPISNAMISGGESNIGGIIPKTNLDTTAASTGGAIADKDFNKGLFIVNKSGT